MSSPSRQLLTVRIDYGAFLVMIGFDQVVTPGPTDNGLVVVEETTARIAAGIFMGQVQVATEGYPAGSVPEVPSTADWSEIVEVPLSVPTGEEVRVSALMDDTEPAPTNLALASDGEYQLRVCAAGRDSHAGESLLEPTDEERYLIQVWPSADPQTRVIAVSDEVGARWRSS